MSATSVAAEPRTPLRRRRGLFRWDSPVRRGSLFVGRLVLGVALVLFLLAPALFVFPLALNGSNVLLFPPKGLGTTHVEAVLTETVWRDALTTSLVVAAIAAVTAVIVGTAAAVATVGTRRLVTTPLETAILALLVVPPIVLSIAWYGVLTRLDLVGTELSIGLLHGFLGVPLVYLNVVAGLAAVDQNIVRAARGLGASSRSAFVLVVVPVLAPSMLAGGVLTFLLSMSELPVALFAGGGVVDTLPVVMWSQIKFVTTPDIAAAAAVLIVLTLVGFGVAAACWRVAIRRASRRLRVREGAF
jgi:putative spermidine/putrescine transport system permease protein